MNERIIIIEKKALIYTHIENMKFENMDFIGNTL